LSLYKFKLNMLEISWEKKTQQYHLCIERLWCLIVRLLIPKCLSHFKDVFPKKNEYGLIVVPNEAKFIFFEIWPYRCLESLFISMHTNFESKIATEFWEYNKRNVCFLFLVYCPSPQCFKNLRIKFCGDWRWHEQLQIVIVH